VTQASGGAVDAAVERLAALPVFADMPREELEWLSAHGRLRTLEAGEYVVPRGEPVDVLWIVMSGRIAVRVDRGAGPRRVMGWGMGEVSGLLPYSRMKAPPGSNYAEELTDILTVGKEHFGELVHRCPTFTEYAVHLMIDRARKFSASDLQDEKMISLGRLAAGLAHELNNPASAAVRGARLLLEALSDAEEASRALGGAALTDRQNETIEAVRATCQAKPKGGVLSPLEQANREEQLAQWLGSHGLDEAHAHPLSETAVTVADLDMLAGVLSGDALEAALRWISAGCSTYSLAADIENAARRIHDLVAAIKRFTYMDERSGVAQVDVESGLRDTVRVVAAKARAKGVSVTLDIEKELPPVRAAGGELNQVWLNLLDNALDAVSEEGHVVIKARRRLNQVVVSVIDDGSGISDDVITRIFDPFFTTKPPGQGTGLGLELTRRIIRQYQGDIAVTSSPGATEFRVSLQVFERPEGGEGP